MRYDAFLTHDWGKDERGRDNHDRVVIVAKHLIERGFKIWLDETEMDGNVNKKMAEGVRESAYVVFFITMRYLEKASGLGRNGDDDNWCAPRARVRAAPRTRRPARAAASLGRACVRACAELAKLQPPALPARPHPLPRTRPRPLLAPRTVPAP
jgi:hypothetical protein